VTPPPSALQAAKLWLVGHVHLAKDALHIYVGLAVFLGSALLFGWRLREWRPWLLTAAVATGGELWDVRDTIAWGRPVVWGANVHDVWNTLFWPTALLLLARRTRLLG
jgi:hypothetical protein